MSSAPIIRNNYSILFDYAVLASTTISFGSNSTVNNGYYGASSYTPPSGPTTVGGSPSGEGPEYLISPANTQLTDLANRIYSFTIMQPQPFTLNNSLTYNSLPNTTFFPYTIYYSNSYITGTGITLTFDAQGDPNAQFFIISESYITFTSVNMVLKGASPSNIFWLARSEAITFSENSATGSISGNFIANAAFSLTNLPVINGNIYSQTASITFSQPFVINGNPVCYLKGTKILTIDGYKLIEDLKVGEKIITKGEIKEESFVLENSEFSFETIKWLGHFTAPNLNKSTFPICIKKNALGINQPFEDLFVSPGHRLIIDGKMILAIDLVNDDTIYQDISKTELIYYHVEFHNHCAIFENGILAESYLDSNNRSIFEKTLPPITNEIIQPKSILA